MGSHSGRPSTVLAADEEDEARRGKRALRRASVGFWVDYNDISLPIVALAPAINYFQPESL